MYLGNYLKVISNDVILTKKAPPMKLFNFQIRFKSLPRNRLRLQDLFLLKQTTLLKVWQHMETKPSLFEQKFQF